MAESGWKLLLLDDDEDDYILLREMLMDLRSEVAQLTWADRYDDALIAMEQGQWDAVLVDYDLGLHTGLEFIRAVTSKGCNCPLIMITGRGSYELDVQAMEAGAADYISKSMLNPPFLERVIRYAIEHHQVEENLKDLIRHRTVELETTLKELQVAEEQLKNQNDNLYTRLVLGEQERLANRELIESFGAGFFITDPDGLILQADSGSERLFNRYGGLVNHQGVINFIAPPDRPLLAQRLFAMKQGEAFQQFRLTVARKELPQVECVVVVKAMYDETSKTTKLHWLIVQTES